MGIVPGQEQFVDLVSGLVMQGVPPSHGVRTSAKQVAASSKGDVPRLLLKVAFAVAIGVRTPVRTGRPTSSSSWLEGRIAASVQSLGILRGKGGGPVCDQGLCNNWLSCLNPQNTVDPFAMTMLIRDSSVKVIRWVCPSINPKWSRTYAIAAR